MKTGTEVPVDLRGATESVHVALSAMNRETDQPQASEQNDIGPGFRNRSRQIDCGIRAGCPDLSATIAIRPR